MSKTDKIYKRPILTYCIEEKTPFNNFPLNKKITLDFNILVLIPIIMDRRFK